MIKAEKELNKGAVQVKVHRKDLIRIVILALVIGAIFFSVFGIITALIPTEWYRRMAPANALDYAFLIVTSALIGAYISISIVRKTRVAASCTASAYGGGAGGFLGFGCTLCNKLLLLLLGAAGAMAYIEPYRPFIGSAGVAMMGYAVYKKAGS